MTGHSATAITIIIGAKLVFSGKTALGLSLEDSIEGQSGVSWTGQQPGIVCPGAQQQAASFFIGHELATATEGQSPTSKVSVNTQFMLEV